MLGIPNVIADTKMIPTYSQDLGDFSRNCQVALEYFRIVMLSDYRGIWEQWQKRNPNQSWSLNNLWDMCYACCISRYVGVEEAARAADYASNKNFWLK